MKSGYLIDNIIRAGVLTILIILMFSLTSAQVRTSGNYQIQSDSINFSGGLSTSTNYAMESTAGEIATGVSTSTNYGLYAGYQQMQETFISMSSILPIVMSPNLSGITAGTANGSTSVLVTTDSPSGYQLTIVSENNPAMISGLNTIDDYVPNDNPNPDFNFTVPSSSAYFGFAVEGDDVTQRWKNDTSSCNTGGNSTALTCWDGLSVTDIVLAQGSANQPSGATTTLYFRVGIGSGMTVAPGVYVATTTLTALPL